MSQPLPIDAYRTLVNPLWARDRRGVIEAVTPITPDACAITIRTNRAWPRHDAGQFVTIGVEIDGVRHHRCYSLTSVGDRSGSQLIEIAVQRVPGGLVSTHLTSAARIGDLVHLSGPDGDFTLPSFVPDRLLLISGGSGVTPLVGIVRTLASRPPHSDVVVVHHAPTAERTMFSAELTRLAARHDWLTVHLVHTRDGGARLDPARLDDLCPDWADRETFVCGPTPLIEFVTDHWDAAGALERLHLERFTPRPSGARRSRHRRHGHRDVRDHRQHRHSSGRRNAAGHGRGRRHRRPLRVPHRRVPHVLDPPRVGLHHRRPRRSHQRGRHPRAALRVDPAHRRRTRPLAPPSPDPTRALPHPDKDPS
ncbi:MAG: ferredoxin reductase [Microthrixaceae bacterium]